MYASYGDYRLYETTRLTATVQKDSADLLRELIAEFGNYPVASSNDLVILSDSLNRLSRVTTDPGNGQEAEKGVETVALVTKLVRGLSSDAADIRLKLDELLRILEKKWYLLELER